MKTDEELQEIIELTYKLGRGEISCTELPVVKGEERRRFGLISDKHVFEKELDKFLKEKDEERWSAYIRSTNTHHFINGDKVL